MRKHIAVAVLLAACGSSQAQIPVTDVASIAESATQHAATILRWVDQYDQMSDQFSQLQDTHEALTGARDLWDVFDDPALRRYLPDDWREIYRAMRRSGYEGLVREALEIYNDNRVFDACEQITLDDQRDTCEAVAIKGAQDQGYASEAYDLAEKRTDQIAQLQAAIQETQDPKAIAELQARISIEQANLMNEHTKLQLFRMMNESEDRLLAQRQREMQARTFSNTRGLDLTPTTFP